jgi:cytochrome c-type biogenesis protein CcmH/NrfF
VSLWIVPLGIAAIGSLVLLLATARATRTVRPATSAITRVRDELTPLMESLRREMSRAAGQRRTEDSGPWQ